MNIKVILFALLFGCVFFISEGIGQVTSVNYQMRYNTTTCKYDCYLIINSGSATTQAQRAQFNAQYSIVVPTGTAVSVAQNFMPLNNNQTYTGTVPLKWQISSTVVAPGAQPQSDFISITPTLSPTSFYNNLAAGDVVKLFSLTVSPVANCGAGIRIYENGVDPGSSADGMGGGDFSNGFTIGGVSQKYAANTPQVDPPKPVLSAVTACSLGLEVDLTATTSVCQSPLTYSWTGPNAYTNTTQDVKITPSTSANDGLYKVTVTDSKGCTSTLNISAVSKPNAGLDKQSCAGTSATLTGTGPNTGTWSAIPANPAGATLGTTTNGAANVDFDVTANGTYKFKYDTGICSDTVNINVIIPDAGLDPAAVGCFSFGTASMAATGAGTWSVSGSSAGTAIINNPTSPTTTVSGFSAPGIYYMVWTVGTCTDIAQITVGSNCTCVVQNNALLSVVPSNYCGTSGAVNIAGAAASPAGGNYRWQYSLNNGTFSDALGTVDQQNYTTLNLGLGTHKFRRIYDVPGSPPCIDTSNVVSFNVNSIPAIPSNLSAIPNPVCFGNTVNLSVSNVVGATYVWTASSPNAGLNVSATNTNSMQALAAGTYTISVTQTINGCTSNAASVNVVVNPTPSTPSLANITSVNPTSCGGSDGSISFSGLNINTTYTINYSKNNVPTSASVSSNGSGIAILAGLSAGTYTNISITTAANCSSGVFAGPITLTNPNAPDAPLNLAADPNPTCSGSTINLSVTNTPGATFAWTASSPNAGLVSSATNSTTMVPLVGGFYTINVTQTVAGCTSVPSSIGVSVNSTPPTPTALTVTGTNPTTCGGTNGFITLSGLLSLTSYDITYSKNAVPVTINLTSNGSGIITIPNLTLGTYTNFSVTNITGCKSGVFPGPVNITDPTSPNAPSNLSAVPNPVCLGDGVNLFVTNNPAATYTWSASPAGAGLVNSITNSTSMLPVSAGTFGISVTQTVAGCISLPATINVVVNAKPPTPSAGTVSSTNPSACGGSNGSISLSGLLNNTPYSINYNKNSSPVTANITTNGSGIAQISGLTAGSYSNFIITNAANCSSGVYVGPVVLSDPNAPAAPSNLSAVPSPVCVGKTVNLSVTNNPGASYTWSASSPSAGLVSSVTNTTTMVPVTAGSFTINVTQTVAGCTSPAATSIVVVNALPATPTAINFTSSNPSVCTGSDGSISISGLTANETYTVNYLKNNIAASASITADGTGTGTITGLTSGSYTGFSLTNAQGCSSGTYNGVINLSDPGSPAAPSNLAGVPNPVCIGSSVNLSVTNNPGAQYTWSASSPNAGLTLTNTNSTSMLPTQTGTFTINVIQTIAGCTSPAATVDIVVNPLPPALSAGNVSGSNPTTCGGNQGFVTISGLPASASYTLNYSKNNVPVSTSIAANGSGVATISGLSAGSYTDFKLTGSGNCQSNLFAGPVTLNDPLTPGAPSGLAASPNPVCLGNSVSLSVTNNPSATYSWSASSVLAGLSNSITNVTSMLATAAGSYTISVTQTVAGCTSPAAFVNVVIDPLPPTPNAASVTSTNPTICSGSDGTISFSGLLASATYTLNYKRDNVAQTANLTTNGGGVAVLTNLSKASYSDFKLTNIQNCSSGVYTGPVILSDPAIPSAPSNLTAVPNPVCLGATVNLSVTNNPAATYSWTSSSPQAGLVASVSNTTSMLAISAATYTISVTQTVNGCLSPVSIINVVINGLPATPVQGDFTSQNPTCALSNGTISIGGLTPNALYTLNYKKNNSPVSTAMQANGSGSLVLLGLSSGSYSDFGLTNSLGCNSGVFAGPIVLTSPGLPAAPSGMVSSPAQVCLRSMVNISVDLNPGATYTWSVSGLGAGLAGGNTNATTMMPTVAGTYTVSVTQTVLGCTSPATTVQVLVKGDCYNPDFDVTYVNVPLTGDVSTNDNIGVLSQYGLAVAGSGNPSSCLPVISSNGKYTFTCGTKGRYLFYVPICSGTITPMCTNIPLVITVLEPLVANNPPIANNDYVRTKMGVAINLNMSSNDRCQSIPNCTLGASTIITPPVNGNYNSVTGLYTPIGGFIGFDSLKYRVCQDPIVSPVNCADAWVYITVVSNVAQNVTNAMDDYGQTPLNTTLIVNAARGVKLNDTDPEGDQQTVTPLDLTITGKGNMKIAADGSYIFTPVTGFTGPVDCPYQICDNSTSQQACDIATLHLLVEPFVPSGSIGNFVWHDMNGDGVQNPGEPGLPGVSVKLYTAAGILKASATTSSNGGYAFENVLADSYYIKFAPSSQYSATFANIGDDAKDSDVDGSFGVGTTGLFVLQGGQALNSIDAGFYTCSQVGDKVWYDINKNDVWNTNENGINGLKVNLWRKHFGTWIIWEYKYTGIKPGSPSDDGYFVFCAPPGQYYVQVVMPPLGLVQALPNVGGNPLIDSDLTNANGSGTTNTFNLVSGVNKLDIGAGFYPMAGAGNLVWRDDNQNGIQESTEAKMAGVNVAAYDATTHQKLAESVTDIDGVYELDYLQKKNVYLKFGVPQGFSATLPRATNDANDSDVDHTYGPNTTRMFSMQPGVINVNIDLGLSLGVLPVDWLSVNATKSKDGHLVSWSTAREVNVSHYELERKTSFNDEFTVIIPKVNASGNTNKVSYYNQTDKDTKKSGTYYYRVKQVDFDGKFTYSKTVQVNNTGTPSVSLYPNPAHSETNLGINLTEDSDVKIELYDSSSKLVKTISSRRKMESGEHNFKINVKEYISGVYNILITMNDQLIQKKLIKID